MFRETFNCTSGELPYPPGSGPGADPGPGSRLGCGRGASRRQIGEAQEADVDLPLQSFPDLEANLIEQVERIRSHPWVKDVPVHSLVYDVETRRLRPIT